jgi:hypothetical protein
MIDDGSVFSLASGCLTMKRHSGLLLAVFVALSATVAGCSAPIKPKPPVFQQDLRPYGLSIDAREASLNYTAINFLSDDIVLICINESFDFAPVQKSETDQPVSRFLVFDVRRNILVSSTKRPVMKRPSSVIATRNGQFVVMDESGIRVCLINLECRDPVSTSGPISISPRGARIITGGDGQTDHVLRDSESLAVLENFGKADVLPGDIALLERRDHTLHIRSPNAPNRNLPFSGDGFGETTRFLSDSVISAVDSKTTIALTTLEGRILSRIDIRPWWDGTGLVTALSGSRFCIHESGYTSWNEKTHFYDIEKTRPQDWERVRVVDVLTGTKDFEFTWDPRPFAGLLCLPALSPDGHSLALIRHGILEIYGIP